MIRIENMDICGLPAAIRGMRNPMNSWELSDSIGQAIGDKDFDLAKRLIAAGPDHSKFRRMITVTIDITAQQPQCNITQIWY